MLIKWTRQKEIFSHCQHEEYHLIVVQQLGARNGCHFTSYKLTKLFPAKPFCLQELLTKKHLLRGTKLLKYPLGM